MRKPGRGRGGVAEQNVSVQMVCQLEKKQKACRFTSHYTDSSCRTIPPACSKVQKVSSVACSQLCFGQQAT